MMSRLQHLLPMAKQVSAHTPPPAMGNRTRSLGSEKKYKYMRHQLGRNPTGPFIAKTGVTFREIPYIPGSDSPSKGLEFGIQKISILP
jgi:hypothetical protein